MPWRLFRQFCAIFLFDKINAELAPLVFPHAFKEAPAAKAWSPSSKK